MGNKIDKEEDRQVTTEEAKTWCRNNGNIPYFETSAMQNTLVDTAFLTMVKKAVDNQSTEALVMPDSIGGPGGLGGNI